MRSISPWPVALSLLFLAATWIAACDKDGITEPDAPNRAPATVGAIPAQTIGAGETVTLDLSPWFNDPDEDMLAYSAQSSNAGLATASTSGNTLTIRAATREAGKNSPETLPPDAPDISPDVSSERLDPEREADIRSLEALYKNRTVTSEAAENAIAISVAAKEIVTITVTARDPEGLTATQSFETMVNEDNQAPVAVGAIPDQTLETGQNVGIDAAPWFADPDGDELSYQAASSHPDVATVAVSGSVVTVQGVAEGDAQIEIAARDPDGLTAAQSFKATVATVPEDNQAPQAVGAIPDQTLETGQNVGIDAAPWFADPDGDELSYQAASAHPNVATVAVSGSVVTVQGVAEGDAQIEIAASDPDGLTAAQSFKATVENTEIRVAFETDAVAAPEGASVTLNVLASSPLESAVTLHYALGVDADSESRAADASDYTDPAEGIIEIPAGSSSGVIEIHINDDGDIEPTREVFTVTLNEPDDGDGYALGSPASAAVQIKEGVCDRTPRVRDQIVREAGLGECADIDDQALAKITLLYLPENQTPAKQGDAPGAYGDPEMRDGNVITSLREKDFDGLVNLLDLSLSRNQLTALPPNLFSDLTKLSHLRLEDNRIATLPSGIFGNLSRLQWLSLQQNQIDRLSKDMFNGLSDLKILLLGENRIANLPEDAFEGLGSLVEINLGHNQIRELPAGAFSNLTQLETLNLVENRITALPAGIFLGLSRMKRVWLHGNSLGAITLNLNMRRTDNENLLAPGPAVIDIHLAQGFPLTMEIPLSISGGTLSANSILLKAGSESSTEVTVTRDANGQDGVQVAAGEIANLRPGARGGIEFNLPDPLTLFGATANSPPVALSQLPAMQFRAGDAPESLKISEYFRDPDGQSLTYAATVADPNVASVDVAGDFVTVRPQGGGSTKITVTATDTDNLSVESVLLASVREDRLGSFKIDLIYLDPEARALESVFQSAADYWMSILADTELPDAPLKEELWWDCTDAPLNQPNPVDPIDDLAIAISVTDFFGVGGGLAAAGVCSVREDSGLPVTGILQLDRADIPHLREKGALEQVILHEIGHTLGIGIIWDDLNLLRNVPASGEERTDTHFAGPLAIKAFDEAGGTNYPNEPKAPVDSNGAHWREEVMHTELMTGAANEGEHNPLSAITIQALADMGYAVNVDQAEAYALPGVVIAKRGAGQTISYGDDVLKNPIRIIDRDGRTVRIIPAKE